MTEEAQPPERIDAAAIGVEEAVPSRPGRRKTVGKRGASATAATKTPGVNGDDVDLDSPDLFLNRELTWLSFNARVLQGATDDRTPLLERVRFLAISSSNLDEFFMKRIGGLKQQVGAGMHQLTVDGRTAQQQIEDCHVAVRTLQGDKQHAYVDITRRLADEGIVLTTYDKLTAAERKAVRAFYSTDIFPLVTPQAMDPAHPFPFVSNLSLNLLVTLHRPRESEDLLARVKVPVGAASPRFLCVDGKNRFVPLEDVMANNLDMLFPGMEVHACDVFRVTRNANTEMDEDRADDLLALIETELRDRKLAPIVRLEVLGGMDPTRRGMLASELGLDESSDVFESDGILGLRDLMELAEIDDVNLQYPDHHPIDNVKLIDDRNIFHTIRDVGSILLHHPYESFSTSVERFVFEASQDPKVLAIKMTLYRTSDDTKIIDYLVDAARNGKQVAVVMELKARFDEAANIRWASRLEEVGIHVTYGVVGLKTHSKVTLVVRRDFNGLRRYAHIGTGNYHAGTARLYTDFGLLTCDDDIGAGLTELFNYLTTGYKPKRRYGKILPAPRLLKSAMLDRIEREARLHCDASPGLIRLKANALEDADIARALYRASMAGVRVELIVRDTCRLRPGIPGLSDNIRVISIVGRFLEHGRVFHFRNGGDDEYFIGSADLMARNLESRVELVVPIEDVAQRQYLDFLLTAQTEDNFDAWEMRSDGTYELLRPGPDEDAQGSQQRLIDAADIRQREATRLRKRKPKGAARRNSVS